MSTFSNEELAELIKSGQAEYIYQLWEQIQALLYSLACKYYNGLSSRFNACGITLDDLQQECFIIMLNMVEAYQPEKGYKFNTYANYQFKKHLRFLLHIGGNYAKKPLNCCKSLSEPINCDGENLSLSDMLQDEHAELVYYSVDEYYYQKQLRKAIDEEIRETLNETEKRLIYQRYYNNATYSAIGAFEQITTMAVKERERRALLKLKRHNNVSKRLDSFRDEIKTIHLYSSTGVSSFKNNQASSVELTVEKINRIINQLCPI